MLSVRTIGQAEHSAYLATVPETRFPQLPAWGTARRGEWQSESLGWFRNEQLVGVGLAMYRRIPGIPRHLVYLRDGPIIDWSSETIADYLVPLTEYLATRQVFAVRIAPPVVIRRWSSRTVKRALADPSVRAFAHLTPDHSNDDAGHTRDALQRLGWRELGGDVSQIGTARPRYSYWLPLSGLDEERVLAGMSQSFRRNIRKAQKSGVSVSQGGRGDLAEFHDIYTETAARDRFSTQSLAFLERTWDALNNDAPGTLKLYFARVDERTVAGALTVHIGDVVTFLYGASTTAMREARGSNAIQWQMIRDALTSGARLYDLYGIGESLDPNDPQFGLVNFKLGTGGEVVEHLVDWELPINRALYTAFTRALPAYVALTHYVSKRQSRKSSAR